MTGKVATAAAVIILAAGCGAARATGITPTTHRAAPAAAMTAKTIATAMHLQGVTAYTAATDPNKLLGRQGEYTSKVNWPDGSIEVFPSAADAAMRLAYLRAFQPPLGDGYDYQDGRALLRLFTQVLPAQAAQLHTAFGAASS